MRSCHFVRCYEPVFLYMVAKKNSAMRQAELRDLKLTVEKDERRIKELDKLIEKAFEKNVLGDLEDERYQKMVASYESEQRSLIQETEAAQKTLSEAEQATIDLRLLLKTLREVTDVRDLTPELVNTLISRIEVHNNSQRWGRGTVKVDIYFTAVGMIDIPTEAEIADAMKEMQENPQKYRLTA